MNWNFTFSIVTPLPVVLWPPTHGISNPLSMVYSTTYPWYVDPLSIVFWHPIHDNLNPLSMIFWTPYSSYVDPLPMAYEPLIDDILNPLPMIFWPLPMVFLPLFPWYFIAQSLVILLSEILVMTKRITWLFTSHPSHHWLFCLTRNMMTFLVYIK